MGTALLEGLTKTTVGYGEMGRMIASDVEALRREVLEMFTDVGRQSRKICLEFVSPRLKLANGERWDTDKIIAEVSRLTEAKHGVAIPRHEVAQAHFQGGVRSGVVVSPT